MPLVQTLCTKCLQALFYLSLHFPSVVTIQNHWLKYTDVRDARSAQR